MSLIEYLRLKDKIQKVFFIPEFDDKDKFFHHLNQKTKISFLLGVSQQT